MTSALSPLRYPLGALAAFGPATLIKSLGDGKLYLRSIAKNNAVMETCAIPLPARVYRREVEEAHSWADMRARLSLRVAISTQPPGVRLNFDDPRETLCKTGGERVLAELLDDTPRAQWHGPPDALPTGIKAAWRIRWRRVAKAITTTARLAAEQAEAGTGESEPASNPAVLDATRSVDAHDGADSSLGAAPAPNSRPMDEPHSRSAPCGEVGGFIKAADLLAEPDEPLAWLVDGLLPAGGLSLAVSKPKVGKSTFGRNLAVAVVQGAPFLDRETAQGTVLYLALEEKRADVKRHLAALGMGVLDQLYLYIEPVPAIDPVGWLRSAIERYQPALVIIDPFGRFGRVKDLNDYAEMTRVTQPLITLAHETETHIHFEHHAGKGERSAIDASIGSTAITGFVDTVIVLKRRGDGVRTVETIQRTGENLSESVIALDVATGHVGLAGAFSETQIERVTVSVVQAVGPTVRTEDAIREAVGGNQSLVAKALRSAHLDGKLIREGSGVRGDPYRYYRPDEKRESEIPAADGP
jgi:hypothetical protein